MQKRTPIRSKKLRNAARGQRCTLRFPHICNHDPATTVLAHLHDATFGMGMKADDTSAVHACSACHAALDLHQTGLDPLTLSKATMAALQATIRRVAVMGVIVVPQDPAPRSKPVKRKPKGKRTPVRQGNSFKRPPSNTIDINADRTEATE